LALDEARFDKGKLEDQLKLVSEEREELTLQKGMSLDIVTHRKDTLNVIDEERQSKKTIQAKDENNIEKVSNLEFIFYNKKSNVFKFYVQHEMFVHG
jgi:flagellar biosynthesis chaperone FliJ